MFPGKAHTSSPLYNVRKLKAAQGENIYQSAIRKACIDKILQLRICMHGLRTGKVYAIPYKKNRDQVKVSQIIIWH